MRQDVLQARPSRSRAPHHLREVLDALELAVLGTEETAAHGALSNPRTASAFGPGSSFRTVDLGCGLWAVARASDDGANRVLCVHNTSDHTLTFAPGAHLAGPDPHALLVFLSGAAHTDQEHGTTVCRVEAHSFVWLGRFSDNATEPIGEFC